MGVRTLPWGGSCWSKVQSLSRSWHKGCRRAHFYRRNQKAGRSNAQVGGTCHFERLERRRVTVWVWRVPLGKCLPGPLDAFLGSFTVAPHEFYFTHHQHLKDRSLSRKQFGFLAPWEASGPMLAVQCDSPMSTWAVHFPHLLHVLWVPPSYMFSWLLQQKQGGLFLFEKTKNSTNRSFMSPSSLLYTT